MCSGYIAAVGPDISRAPRAVAPPAARRQVVVCPSAARRRGLKAAVSASPRSSRSRRRGRRLRRSTSSARSSASERATAPARRYISACDPQSVARPPLASPTPVSVRASLAAQTQQAPEPWHNRRVPSSRRRDASLAAKRPSFRLRSARSVTGPVLFRGAVHSRGHPSSEGKRRRAPRGPRPPRPLLRPSIQAACSARGASGAARARS